jgi:hypothetical protein
MAASGQSLTDEDFTTYVLIFGIDWLRLDWFLCNPNQLPMAGFPL